MRVLFTGYAPVHFLCFKPLYEALVRTPGVEVQLSGGARSKSPQAPGGYLYDADQMYSRFELPEGTVLPVAALTNSYMSGGTSPPATLQAPRHWTSSPAA